MTSGGCIQYTHNVCILWFMLPHSGKPSFPLSEPLCHLLQEYMAQPTAVPSPFLSGPSCSESCSNTCRLLSLLALLLERALQKSAVHGVIHILVLEPGAQHSLSLFFPLDYVCSIKCIFKSHIRGCGLKLASITLQKGMAFDTTRMYKGLVQTAGDGVPETGHQPRMEGPLTGGSGTFLPAPVSCLHLEPLSSRSPPPRDFPQNEQDWSLLI